MYWPIKVVALGDSGVGKTCLFVSYTTNATFPLDYIPRVFESFAATYTVDGITVTLALFDTAGEVQHDRLRPLSYLKTDVFLICFSLVDPDTYDAVRTKWYPELKHYGPSSAGIILVGTKLDLRDDPRVIESSIDRRIVSPISYSQGVAMTRDIGISKYFECSAFTCQGVKEIFEEAMRLANNRPAQKEKTSCIIV